MVVVDAVGVESRPAGKKTVLPETRIAEVDEEPDVRSNPRLILAPVAVLSPHFFHSSSLLPFCHSRSLAVAVARLLLPPSLPLRCVARRWHRLAAAVVGPVVGIVHLLAVLRRFELQEFFDPLLLCYSLKLSF